MAPPRLPLQLSLAEALPRKLLKFNGLGASWNAVKGLELPRGCLVQTGNPERNILPRLDLLQHDVMGVR